MIRYQKLIEDTPVPLDPVFIVGHWRTGSTLLHQLIDQDPEMSAPTLFQVALPGNFIVSYRFYKPIFRMLMGTSRPMDNVKIGMNEPQEDEYAIFRLTTRSPLEKLIFPAKKEYFVIDSPFLPDIESLPQWELALENFYRKIHFVTGKRIISKNPFNSLRIPLLARLFPEARFIHIVRHPFAVVPSTRHLWNIVQKQNVLNDKGYTPTLEEISTFFSHMSDTVSKDLAALPDHRVAEIRYEDLEHNAVASLKTLYRKTDLPFTSFFEHSLLRYLTSINGYQKNLFSLTNEEKQVIVNIMGKYMYRYGYGLIV